MPLSNTLSQMKPLYALRRVLGEQKTYYVCEFSEIDKTCCTFIGVLTVWAFNLNSLCASKPFICQKISAAIRPELDSLLFVRYAAEIGCHEYDQNSIRNIFHIPISQWRMDAMADALRYYRNRADRMR